MNNNPVKTKLLAGEPMAGAFVSIESPTTVELLALAGLDFVMIDAEHFHVDPKLAGDLVRAAEARDIPMMARVGENNRQVISKYLDAGCLGIMTPMVNSQESSKAVVEAVKYPPLGKRGLAGVRANDFGLSGGLGRFVQEANDQTVVMVQIETLEAVEKADEIINVDGVDIVFLGPTDLSVALGVPGDSKNQLVLDTIESLAVKITKAGKTAGTIANTPEDYAYWRARGVSMFLTGANRLLASAARAYVEGIRISEREF